MKRSQCWLTAVVVFISVATAEAGFKTTVGGVTVSYSGNGEAYFDPDDNTLTIDIFDSGGSLKVTVGATATAFWGEYVDIYLLADQATFKSISIKGTANCTPFVCGQVGYVSKFSLFGGVVGDTDTYGLDFGLGVVSSALPAGCNLKYSYTTAQLLGYEYTFSATGTLAADGGTGKTRTLDAARIAKRQLIQKIQNQLAAPPAVRR